MKMEIQNEKQLRNHKMNFGRMQFSFGFAKRLSGKPVSGTLLYAKALVSSTAILLLRHVCSGSETFHSTFISASYSGFILCDTMFSIKFSV